MKTYYLINHDSVKPVEIIKKLPSSSVKVKDINSGTTFWVSDYNLRKTKEEAYKKILLDLEYDKEYAERAIRDAQQELAITNQAIKKLKQEYGI